MSRTKPNNLKLTLLKMLTTVRPSCFTLSNTWQNVRCSNVRVSIDEDDDDDDADDDDDLARMA